MSESAIAQAILDEIKRLAAQFERFETRMETRMESLEKGMSKVEGRLSAVEGHVWKFESRMASLESRMSNIEDVVADLDTRIKTWPDMHFLGAAVKAQMTQSREIRNEVADISVRVREIYQTMATDPEIKSLRDEISRFRDRRLTTKIRLGAIEGRLGIRSDIEAPV